MNLFTETIIEMIQCQNCGQGNTANSQFCRFCGSRFPEAQRSPQNFGEYPAPRPYSWKTDEFQTQAEARPTADVYRHPATPPFQSPKSAVSLTAHPQYMTGSYRCPNCMSQFLPVTERRVSTAGWITFAVLLAVVFPLFWIGLLIKEDVHVCPSCKKRLQ